MNENLESGEPANDGVGSDKPLNAWQITGRICAVVVFLSLVACVTMAVMRSKGLVAVTVTALDPDAEPKDHKIPFVKKREALPDYELALIGDDGDEQYLGVKPDESAAAGLTWQLDDPASLSHIAAVRLREKDQMVSDQVAEVHITAPSVESNGYRFEFETRRSFGVGVRAFFGTPIGFAIMAGFGLAVFFMVVGNISV